VHRKCYYLKFRIVHHYYHHCCASSHFRIKYTRLVVGRTVSVYIYILCTFFLPPINQSSKQSTHSSSFCTVFLMLFFFVLVVHNYSNTLSLQYIYIYINLRYTHLLTHLRSLLFLFGFLFFWDSESGIVKAEEV